MKEKDVLTGYVLTDAERAAQKYIAPFGIGLMAIFACILWIEAVKSGGSVIHYLFACCLSAPTIFLVINSFRMRSIVELTFCIDAKTVSNFSKGKKTSLHHFQTQFITVLTRDFAYGKATVTKKFYLFSPHPIAPQYIRGQGLSVLKRLSDQNIIIIPQNQSTEAWVIDKLHLASVPDYPVVACLQGNSDEM